jgi:adenylate cyclase
VRGFSTYCKTADPVEVQEVLHEYLTEMTRVIRDHGGTLDKYMGDGVMAFFGDAEPEDGGPQVQESLVARHAANAVQAAIAMQREMARLNAQWTDQKRECHVIRIGINTGVVTVGNLGTDYLWDYTVVGTEVNKAQRLEGAGQPGGILLAHRTYLLARKEGALTEDIPAQTLALKGLGEEAELRLIPAELVARLAADETKPAAR